MNALYGRTASRHLRSQTPRATSATRPWENALYSAVRESLRYPLADGSTEHNVSSPARVGIFGGTFDPPHVGHLIIAEILRQALDLAEVRFLPAGRPPHKVLNDVSADHHRLAMLDLAMLDAPHFSISRVDIDRQGLSYTADSLTVIRNGLGPETEMLFLMGQDSMRDLPNWSRPERIVNQARLGVALRPGFDVSVADVVAHIPEAEGRIELVDVPLIGISSRDLRATIRAGGPYRYQVLPSVYDYIEQHHLYRSPRVDVDAP